MRATPLFLVCTALVVRRTAPGELVPAAPVTAVGDPRFLLLPATLESDRLPFKDVAWNTKVDRNGRPLALVQAVRGRNMFEVVRDAEKAPGTVPKYYWGDLGADAWKWSEDTWALWSVKARVTFVGEDGAPESGSDDGGLRRELLQLALKDAVTKSGLLQDGPQGRLVPVMPTPLLDPLSGAITTVPGADGTGHVLLGKLLAAVLTGYKWILDRKEGAGPEISNAYISPLRLDSVVYEAALAPEARPPAPPAGAGEIAACERLVPVLGNDWFYGLDTNTNTRKYKTAAEVGLMTWGAVLKSTKDEDAEVSADEADEWAQLACTHLWATYCAPALEGVAQGLADALGAPLGAARADEVRALGLAGVRTTFEGMEKVDRAALFRASDVAPQGHDMLEGGTVREFMARWAPTWKAALAQLEESELEDFLQFVTGNRNLPSAGEFNITVQIVAGDTCGPIVAHTCFDSVHVAFACLASADTLAAELKSTLRLNREYGGGFGTG